MRGGVIIWILCNLEGERGKVRRGDLLLASSLKACLFYAQSDLNRKMRGCRMGMVTGQLKS
jgi:hypothetical protein